MCCMNVLFFIGACNSAQLHNNNIQYNGRADFLKLLYNIEGTTEKVLKFKHHFHNIK